MVPAGAAREVAPTGAGLTRAGSGIMSSVDATEVISVELDESERRVLAAGLDEWGGPARPTEELAIALGFEGLDDFDRERPRLKESIESNWPLSRLDWARVLLATEIVFASDVVGSGHDWVFTVGLSDDETLRFLRTIQRKLTGEVRPVLGRGLGTRPD